MFLTLTLLQIDFRLRNWGGSWLRIRRRRCDSEEENKERKSGENFAEHFRKV